MGGVIDPCGYGAVPQPLFVPDINIDVRDGFQPHWVQPPDNRNMLKGKWNNVLVCDVWGVKVPWKIIGSVVARHFRAEDKVEFVMLPVGLPTNCAHFCHQVE